MQQHMLTYLLLRRDAFNRHHPTHKHHPAGQQSIFIQFTFHSSENQYREMASDVHLAYSDRVDSKGNLNSISNKQLFKAMIMG